MGARELILVAVAFSIPLVVAVIVEGVRTYANTPTPERPCCTRCGKRYREWRNTCCPLCGCDAAVARLWIGFRPPLRWVAVTAAAWAFTGVACALEIWADRSTTTYSGMVSYHFLSQSIAVPNPNRPKVAQFFQSPNGMSGSSGTYPIFDQPEDFSVFVDTTYRPRDEKSTDVDIVASIGDTKSTITLNCPSSQALPKGEDLAASLRQLHPELSESEARAMGDDLALILVEIRDLIVKPGVSSGSPSQLPKAKWFGGGGGGFAMPNTYNSFPWLLWLACFAAAGAAYRLTFFLPRYGTRPLRSGPA